MSLKRLWVALVIGTFLVSASAIRADEYKVDPVHTSVIFRIQHLGVSYLYGRFNDKSGTVTIDESDPTKDAFDVSVKADSIDTGNSMRDKDLKSGDFFSAQEFPEIKFKSTSVKSAGDNKLDVAGDITMHGATKPITVTLTRTGTKETRMGHRTGLEGTFTVKRSDFGMTKMLDAVGDEVTLTVSIEAVK